MTGKETCNDGKLKNKSIMKKLTLTISFIALIQLMCTDLNSQNFIKIDASFYSEVLDTVKKVDIYLPKDYYEHPDQQYATIYYLHGGDGNQNEGNEFAHHYYNTHAESPLSDSVPAAIFVCPNGDYDPYYGSYWVNSVLYGNFEDYIINDLFAFIESQFRARTEKDFRFITGYSMGGFGSAHIALSNPDKFRACSPMSAAYMGFADTVMNLIKQSLYEENGGYHFDMNAGSTSRFFFTLSGAYAPNLEIEPHHMEFLWDTNGNWVDTVWTKWQNFDCSSEVKNLSPENNLSFFLTCGTIDDILCYPPYLQFEDTLTKYNVDYRSIYSEYIHGLDDTAANANKWRWFDSLAYVAYQHLGTDEFKELKSNIRLFPNPAKNEVSISVKGGKIIKEVNIYNQIGQRVIHKKQITHTIDVSMLRHGIYIIEVEIDNGKYRSKLMIE